jgi:hypothetical protein
MIHLLSRSSVRNATAVCGVVTDEKTPRAPGSAILSRWVRLLLENTLHQARADTELQADLEDPVPADPQFQYSRFNCELDATRPSFAPFALARARPA